MRPYPEFDFYFFTELRIIAKVMYIETRKLVFQRTPEVKKQQQQQNKYKNTVFVETMLKKTTAMLKHPLQ